MNINGEKDGELSLNEKKQSVNKLKRKRYPLSKVTRKLLIKVCGGVARKMKEEIQICLGSVR